MKKLLFVCALIFVQNVSRADSMLEWVAGDYEFGPEDIYPKKTAEEIYGREIIESEDKAGLFCQDPDACGEDIFGPPLEEDDEEEEEEVEVTEEAVAEEE